MWGLFCQMFLHAMLLSCVHNYAIKKTQTLPKEVLNRGSFKGQPYDVIVSHVVFTGFSVMCLWYWKKKKATQLKKFLPTCEKPYNCGILLGQNITVPLARHTGNVARKFKEKTAVACSWDWHISCQTPTRQIYTSQTLTATLSHA